MVIAFLFKEIEFMDIFASIFNVNGDELVVITLCFFVVLGFCEAFLVHVVSDSELEKLSSRVEKNESVPAWFLICFGVNFIAFIILYFVNNLYSVLPMLLSFVFLIPYVVYGIMNFRYKVITVTLIVIFFFISLFIVGYIESLNYLAIPMFILSPFIINNFKDIKGKNF